MASDFPNDYGQPADSPLAFNQLATDVDNAIGRALPWALLSSNTDTPLTADSRLIIPWESFAGQPSGTTRALSHTAGTLTVLTASGMYLVELAVSVTHGSVGAARTFELVVDRLTGSDTGEYSVPLVAIHAAPGWPTRIGFAYIGYFAKNDTYRCLIQAVTSEATGWTATYARHAITAVR